MSRCPGPARSARARRESRPPKGLSTIPGIVPASAVEAANQPPSPPERQGQGGCQAPSRGGPKEGESRYGDQEPETRKVRAKTEHEGRGRDNCQDPDRAIAAEFVEDNQYCQEERH